MKTIFQIVVSVIVLSALNNPVYCQTTTQKESSSIIEEAHYPSPDLTRFLITETAYPEKARINVINGDVVLSFIIRKSGQLDSLAISGSPNNLLSKAAFDSFTSIKGDWIPCKVDNIPIDKKYLVVFRFRCYLNSIPEDFTGKAKQYFEEKKYEKTLKFLDKAIKDNEFSSSLFNSRSIVKGILGDNQGATQDSIKAQKLIHNVMTIVDIVVDKTIFKEETIIRGTFKGPIYIYKKQDI